MSFVFNGRTVSFAVHDEWVIDPMLSPLLSQQYLTYRFVPMIALRDGILYGSMQIREVANTYEKMNLDSQLQALSTPVMATTVLANIGVQPQNIAGQIQQIEIQGRPCKYRIVDGVALMTGQPVRCYLGLIDMDMLAVEIIAVAVISAWPVLVPQILEMFTSIKSKDQNMSTIEAKSAPIYVNREEGGAISYKVKQLDDTIKVFDKVQLPENTTINFIVNDESINIDKDTQINGNVIIHDESNTEVSYMSNDRIVKIGNNARVRDIDQSVETKDDHSVKSSFDVGEFAKVIDMIIKAVQETDTQDNKTKLALLQLEQAKLQAEGKEDVSQVKSTLQTAADNLKTGGQVLETGLNIGGLLMKAAKMIGLVIPWLV